MVANNIGPDHMRHYVASDLDLLSMTFYGIPSKRELMS